MIYLDFEAITANEGPLHQSPFFNYLINLISKITWKLFVKSTPNLIEKKKKKTVHSWGKNTY